MDIKLNEAEKAKEELMHFGVLGMHWGRRRGPSRSAVSIRGKKAIVTNPRSFRKSTVDKNPDSDEWNRLRNPISSRTRKAAQDKFNEVTSNSTKMKKAQSFYNQKTQMSLNAKVFKASVAISIAYVAVMGVALLQARRSRNRWLGNMINNVRIP